MKNGAVTPLRSYGPVDDHRIQLFDLFLIAWEQAQLFRMNVQAKISSEKIISSA